MSAATMVVVAVAFRASAQPHRDAGTTPLVAPERPTHTTARSAPPKRSRPGARQSPSPRPSPSPGSSPTAHPTTATSRPATKSVVVAGQVVQTQYGPVQVEITVRGGRITKARTLAHPSGGESDQINGYAVPLLDQEAVAAQSAQIDTVSGATFTSAGYQQSLQSALDAAHQAGAR
jgi:uncharacterized protein with FMN-binding domain